MTRFKSPFAPGCLALLAGLALLALLAQPGEGLARRKQPAPKPQPRPAPSASYVTVRCGPDIGSARLDAVLVFGETKVPMKTVRSVALVKRERFTGARANEKCCETVVSTEGAVHTIEGGQLAVSGKAELPMDVDKTPKTCSMDLTTDQTSSFKCYPEVVSRCPTSSHSKVEVLLLVF
ncbi:MAG: hypothetical protein RBU30_06745 [Polyangia bacterium]|jgi:hypothetical protein|nr:hypothetical protein [Polyangia bacterium]